MTTGPAVSVIVPVHDKAPHLDRSIGSVLAQTFTDFELILVDDASTDGSAERLAEVDDPRVRLFHRATPGPGGYAARNLGLEEARAPWTCFLDADDEWHPELLATVDAVRREHPDVDVVATGWEEGLEGEDAPWAGDGDPTAAPSRPFGFVDYLRRQRLLWVCNTSMRTDLLRRAGGFPTAPGVTRGGDIDTLVRCMWHARSARRVTPVLAVYYRDAVNRVTDISRDPRPTVPALDSLADIRRRTTDREVVAAIDRFANGLIYTQLWRSTTMGLPLDTGLIRRMRPSVYSASRLAKLLVHRARVRLRR